jgi:adenosylcobinamide-phosphate synthase
MDRGPFCLTSIVVSTVVNRLIALSNVSANAGPLRPIAAAAGIGLDLIIGEPRSSVHPVVHFGRVMKRFEDIFYFDNALVGTLHAVAGLGIGLIAGKRVRSTALATALSVGGRALDRAALDVRVALERGDIERARQLLPALVGRDPTYLDEAEIARAVVESVAENTVDAVSAPAWWAALLGGAGALGYRAVNTMDAMVGHRSPRYEHYGWASARLDDVANWIPARLTCLLVIAVRPRAARAVVHALRTQAPAHSSPNAGMIEAAFAAALGIELGGVNHYGDRHEERPLLGCGRRANTGDIARAVRLKRDLPAALVAAL